MSAIICLPVDFKTNSLGLPSLLTETVDSAPVLYHTVSRLTLSDDYEVVLLFTGENAQHDAALARDICGGLACRYHVSAASDVPNRELLRRSRLWSISSWRGGIGSTSYYDEAGSHAAMAEAAGLFDADTVGLMTPDSPYADPHLASEILAWHYDRIRKARVTVTGVPPGLAPAFFNIEVVKAYAKNNLTLAASLAYRRDIPQRDMTATEAHFESDIELRTSPWRFTVHSPRQLAMVRALTAAGLSPRSAKSLDVVRAVADDWRISAGDVPARIEIEPTSRFDAAPFYLRDFAAGRALRDMSMEAFEHIVASLSPHNDVVLSLEGLGEPLLNDALAGMVAAARAAGVMGVHVGTAGRLLDDDRYSALVSAGLDILSVFLGAHSEETYRRVFGVGGLAGVRAFVQKAVVARRAAGRFAPLLIAELVKTRVVEGEIEEFFDHWYAAADGSVIRPYNDFAGQVEDAATIHMRTSSRGACRKILTELYIDSDGTAYPCRQDIRRTRPLGNAAGEGVGALWRCEFMEQLRAAHAAGDYDFFPLCRNCKDWYYS